MNSTARWLSGLACVAALGIGAAPTAARAQAASGPGNYQQVISANPLGLLVELFNAEYERKVSQYSTAGIGGSTYQTNGDDYLNADVFWRYYPQGRPLDGFAFGVKAGITSLEGETRPGIGFDANYSWLLGKKQNFYVGLGFGLKRIIGGSISSDSGDEIFDLQYVPTFRLVNIGFAF